MDQQPGPDADIIRGMIRYEDDVINHRLTWLGQLQGFLFAALALTWNDHPKFAVMLALVGIVVAFSVGTACCIGDQAIKSLVKLAPDSIQPGVIGQDVKKWRFILPWFLVPAILLAAWVAVLVRALCRLWW